MNLSVLICTHNPRVEYLVRTLEALRGQTLPMTDWELLLIDNASCPPVSALVNLEWHPNARHVREEVLGLTPARLRGIQEAQGQVLVFIDDDGVLDSSYLETAMQVSHSRPDLGCWGAGLVEPEYEKPPPEWLAVYEDALAIRRLDRDLWANIPDWNASLPCGIGMCLRRAVAVRYASLCRSDAIRRSLGRAGESLASCEDSDIAMLACALGMGTGSFTALKITHLIPEGRTTPQYMNRLLAGIAESQVLLWSLYRFNHDELRRRLQVLKWRLLFLWIHYVASGFSVHCRLALSKARGELHGCKRLYGCRRRKHG